MLWSASQVKTGAVIRTGLLMLGLGLFPQVAAPCPAAETPNAVKTVQPPELPQRLRGININPATLAQPGFIPMVAGWHVNVLRVNIGADQKQPPTAENALAPYAQALHDLDQALPQLRAAHIKLIICAANTYGRSLDVMWQKTDSAQATRDHLAQFWSAFARRYRNQPDIVAYDVFNEPNYKPGQAWTWYDDMLPKAVAAIRKVNPTIWLIVEPGPWGLPDGFAQLKPLADPYVIYSFHHYAPHRYCHQGIQAYKDVRGKLTYPGLNKMFNDSPEKYWDKKALEESMRPVIDFQARYHVRILVGEFGVLRWAPGAARWLADSISIFEQHGWDWCFHSVGGWNGWDPTWAADAPESNAYNGGKVTDRLKVLLKGWAANTQETTASR